jgi:exonuclease V
MYPALPLRDSTLSSKPDADDHSSDYGSDFTSEEEELINALLGKFPADDISGVSATAAIPAPTSTLGAVALVDIEDQQHVLAAVREAREGQPALSGEAVEEELGYRVG